MSMFKKTLISASILLGAISLSACNNQEKEIEQSKNKEATQQTHKKVSEPLTAKKIMKKIAEGIHYDIIENPIERPANEVLEFFWYGCSHCLTADPYVKSWEEEAKKLGKYKLTAVHSNLNDDWAFDSFVFYSLNSLGKEKEVHSAYFKARQDGTIGSDESVAAFFKSYGVTIEQMQKEMEKPELIGVINEMLAREIQVKSKGTPSFIVGGKYMVKLEGLGDFGGWSGLGEILNQLAEKSINESQKK